MEREPNHYLLLDETLETWWKHAVGDPLDESWNPDDVVPCSRYGRTAGECAWYSVAGLIAFDASAGIENQVEGIILLDDLMGLAVNDSRDLALLILECWDSMREELREHLPNHEDLTDLMY